MAGGINPERVETVQRHVYDALARTSVQSTLSEEEQDRLLAQACVESCDLISDWLESPEWENLRPAGHQPIADSIPDWARIRPFLDPLKETVARISRHQEKLPGLPETSDPAAYIDNAIRSAEYTARRHRRYNRRQLFATATERLRELRASVCGLAAEFAGDLRARADDQESQRKRRERRKRALSVLGIVANVLLSVSLTMAGASPHDVRQHVPEWGHEAVKVLFVHHLAQSAQPSVRVAPPRLGPRVG